MDDIVSVWTARRVAMSQGIVNSSNDIALRRQILGVIACAFCARHEAVAVDDQRVGCLRRVGGQIKRSVQCARVCAGVIAVGIGRATVINQGKRQLPEAGTSFRVDLLADRAAGFNARWYQQDR